MAPVTSVYVIGAEPLRHKIGVSVDVKARRASLQTGHYNRLTIEYATPVDRAVEVERTAHGFLADKRLEGEWFAVDARTATEAVGHAKRSLFWRDLGSVRVGEGLICVSNWGDGVGWGPQVGHIYTFAGAEEGGWHIDLTEFPEADRWWALANFMPAPVSPLMNWGIELSPVAANGGAIIHDPGDVI